MKKKVLIVAPYNNGTIAMCTRNLFMAMKELEDLEVKCVVVHKFTRDILPEFDGCDFCVTKEAHPLLKWTNLIKQVLWLRGIKKSFCPDVTISTLGGCSTINVLSGGRDLKVGIFHSPHYQEKAKGKIVYLNTLLNFKFVYPRLNRLACVSKEVKNSLIDAFPWLKNKDVRVVYNIHNTEVILEKAKEELTEQEQKYVDENTLLYIGRFDKNKAPMRALEAFVDAIDNLPAKAKLVFIGKDEQGLTPDLEKMVIQGGLSDRIRFFGYKTNPYKFLVRARGLISSSYSEGLPGVMIESLLLKKPIVTTNSSEGIWEILSCDSKYNEILESYFKCEDGIITSNKSFKDKNFYTNDIISLSLGIQELYKLTSRPSFAFQSQIKKDCIINKLIEE